VHVPLIVLAVLLPYWVTRNEPDPTNPIIFRHVQRGVARSKRIRFYACRLSTRPSGPEAPLASLGEAISESPKAFKEVELVKLVKVCLPMSGARLQAYSAGVVSAKLDGGIES
jgi:hypothetical protein